MSRIGSVELISICFSTLDVYIVDYSGNPGNISAAQRMLREHLKRLFESKKVIKIVHDSRMDSDALFHLHGIELKNVHDTSCFHYVITGLEDKSLNDVLKYNNFPINSRRDKSIYKRNPSFWATRPISKDMIDWATSDVDKMYSLALMQLTNVDTKKKAEAMRRSEQYMLSCRNMNIMNNLRVSNPARFIGPKGSSIRRLSSQTGTMMYQDPSKQTWFLYYPNVSALNTVRQAMSG